LQTILRVNAQSANKIVAIAVLIGMSSLIVFGALSDRIGRKKLMMAGCLLAVVGFFPIYKAMERAAGNHVVTAQSWKDPVTGAIALTPLTKDASGALVPAPEAPAPNIPMLIFLIFVQLIFTNMVLGPIAAYLVEAFPAKIRYTSFSLPYHIGNGVFGGLQPLIGLWTIAATGNIYAGLWYPVIMAGITFVVGTLLLRETQQVKIWDEVAEKHRLEVAESA
jgi:MFS family permease